MTTGTRIFLVVAIVVTGGFGVVRVFDGGSPPSAAAARAATPPTTSAQPTPSTTAPDPPASVVQTTDIPTTVPPSSTLAAELSAFCPGSTHAAVVDRDRQRAWLCEAGTAVYEFAFTGAISQPDPGTYAVYAKDMRSSSKSSAGVSTMTHFVAFTYGKFRGARIAFHSMPVWQRNGEWVQPLDSIGDVSRRGESAGCLRLLPDDAVKVWDWLSVDDEVRVIN